MACPLENHFENSPRLNAQYENSLKTKHQGFNNDLEVMTQKSWNNGRSISSSVSYDRLREMQTQDKQNSSDPNFTIHCNSNKTWNTNEPSAPLPESQCLREKSLQNVTSGV